MSSDQCGEWPLIIGRSLSVTRHRNYLFTKKSQPPGQEVAVVDATRCHRLVLQKEFVGRFVVSHRLHAARLRPGTQTGGLRARAVVPVRRYVRTAPTM